MRASFSRLLRALLLLVLALQLSGCSWLFVPATPDHFERSAGPCESSYTWPIADAGVAGLGVPATGAGVIYALQASCERGLDCGQRAAASLVTAVITVIAVFVFIGAHHDGMRRVTRCRAANIRWRFANLPSTGASQTALASRPSGPVATELPPGQGPRLAEGVGLDAGPKAGSAPDPDFSPELGSDLAPEAALSAPPVALPELAGSLEPVRELEILQAAIAELTLLSPEERESLRQAALGLTTDSLPRESWALAEPWDGRRGLMVAGTGRILVYRIDERAIVIEAILPEARAGDGAAFIPPP